MDGRRHPLPVPTVTAEEVMNSPLVEPPADLSDRRKVFWRAYAPLAIKEGTLTLSRVLGFRQLVSQLDLVDALDAKIQELGTASRDAAEYRRDYVKLAQRLDSTMARFKLTSSGKSEAQPKPKAQANPWGSVVAR